MIPEQVPNTNSQIASTDAPNFQVATPLSPGQTAGNDQSWVDGIAPELRGFQRTVEAPRFFGMCSVKAASRTGIVIESLLACVLLYTHLFLLAPELGIRLQWQLIAAYMAILTALIGTVAVFGKRRTTMQILCLLQMLSMCANAGAAIVLAGVLMGQKLHVRACDSSDCPIVINRTLVNALITLASSVLYVRL